MSSIYNYNFTNICMFEAGIFIKDNKPQPMIKVQGDDAKIIKASKKEPKVVYHYCDRFALDGILKNNCFWLSSLSYTNDKNEMTYFYNLFDEFIKNNYVEEWHKPILDKVKEIFKYNIQEAFSASFTQLSDAKGQWNDYGDNCSGYNIGINTTELPFTRDIPKLMDGGAMSEICTGFVQINYKKKFHESRIKSIINELLQGNISIADAGYFLSKMALVFKDKWFHEEKEWRILYTPGLPFTINNKPGRITFNEGLIQGRFNNNGISYFSYVFPKSLISEIKLGPKNNIDINELKEKLISYNYDLNKIKITKSDGNYR